MNRRRFLSMSALASASLALPPTIAASTQPGTFDFIFLTDSHIEPELAAADGCAMCFKKIHNMKAEFAIQGGDHIYDALTVNRQRAEGLFDLYAKTEQDLGLKVHHVIGNHDVFGVYPSSGVGPAEPGYGKQMYQDRMGSTYYSFDHKGYHFIVLDSIQITEDRSYEGGVDAAQISWLRKDLGNIPAGMPVIVTTHVPLVTGALSYEVPKAKPSQILVANAYDVLPVFDGHNVLAVLQGHLHVNEVITFKGIPYVTSGAVSGNWWHGIRLGTPEGFTVVSLHDGKISWRYETYGFKSIDPQNG